MATVRSYRELDAWKKAMQLVTEIYSVTKSWPHDELYGLTQQIRKAAVSVPANIAEGQGRRTTKEFLRFLAISHGSLREVETHLLISYRLGYTPREQTIQLMSIAAEAGKLNNALSNVLKERMRNKRETVDEH